MFARQRKACGNAPVDQKGSCAITTRWPTGREEGVSCWEHQSLHLTPPSYWPHRHQREPHTGRKTMERNWRIWKSWTTEVFTSFIETLGFVSQTMKNYCSSQKGWSWSGPFWKDHMNHQLGELPVSFKRGFCLHIYTCSCGQPHSITYFSQVPKATHVCCIILPKTPVAVHEQSTPGWQ